MRRNSEAKRSAHEEFSHLDRFLQDCEGLTYILLSWEHGNTVHPTLLDAIALAQYAYNGMAYEPPYGHQNSKKATSRNRIRQSEVLKRIAEGVEALRRLDVEFVFIWHLAVEGLIHEDVTAAFANRNYFEDVVEVFAEGLRERMVS